MHPRLKVKEKKILGIMLSQAAKLGKPLEVSYHSIWSLYDKTGAPGLKKCAENKVKLNSLYGYPLQFVAWLQLLGKKDLGRLHLSIVPEDGRWYLASLHATQWTHLKKDFRSWLQEAESDWNNKKYFSAYIKINLASKLIYPNDYFEYDLYQELLETQNFEENKKINTAENK